MCSSDLPSFISLKGKITETDKTQLLYTYVDSISAYQLDVPDGNYTMQLYFAEPEYTTVGKRVFDVMINGTIMKSFFKEFDYCVAVEKTIQVSAVDNKGIHIDFKALKGKAILNGIHVQKN